MDAQGEVMLTIIASLAQQESQSLSQNVKIGLQYRYQQGDVQVNCSRFLGYTRGESNKLVIVHEEADVVKRIYREYPEGASMLKIARGLMADGILNGARNEKWHTSNLKQILRNEKYIGDALLQKTYTTDFLTKKRVKNNGYVPQYYIEDNHDAIISREVFMHVHQEMIQRRCVHTGQSGKREHSAATTVFHKSSSAVTAARFSSGSIGIIALSDQSYGAAPADWKILACSAMPGQFWKAPSSRFWSPPSIPP